MKKLPILCVIVLTCVLLVVAPGCAKAILVPANLTINPQEVAAGQSATISVDINNTGKAEGTCPVVLKIGGIQVDTQNVTVGPGATQKVSFAVTMGEAGSCTVDVNGLTKTFMVLKPAEFKIETLTASPATVAAGWDTTVTVDVTNIGEVEGDCEVTLKVNNNDVETKKVTVGAGATETVSFTVVEDKGGTYNLSAGEASGTLTVKEGAIPVLHVGDQWVYREMQQGVAYTRTETITGEEIADGKSCYVVKVTYDPKYGGWVSERTEWWEKADCSRLRWQFSATPSSGKTVNRTWSYSYSATGSPQWPLIVGNEWTEAVTIKTVDVVEGYSYPSEEKYEGRYKVEAIETVTTNAGTFRCFKIVYYQGGKATAQCWYSDRAKAIVKVQYLTSQDSDNLLSYSVKDGGL